MKKKIALLWIADDPGLYSNQPFDALFAHIGHNNGNLAFVYAIANQLDADISIEKWRSSAEIFNQYDAIVFPAANQFGNHCNLSHLVDNFERVEVPIIAIGLGAQATSFADDVTPPEGTIRWAKAIYDRRFSSAPNIYTRGPFSSRQLARFGMVDTVIGGCPTHFISADHELGKTIEMEWLSRELPRSVTVCAGHQSWAAVSSVEQQLIALMMDPVAKGQYIVQSMAEMIMISRGLFDDVQPDALEQIRKYTVPHYSSEQFKAWCRNYARSFYDVPAWMDSLRNYDLTIGARYHGVQLALQAGKMGCVIAHDTRTEEMCVQTGVPHLQLAGLDEEPIVRSRLKKLIAFNGEVYDAHRRERARNYVAFLQNNGLQPKPYLLKLAGA